MAGNPVLQILISARDAASTVLRGVGRVLGDIRTQVALLISSFGLLRAAEDAIGAAASLEDLQVQMTGLLGSSDAAQAKIKELNDAFGLRQVDSATSLFVKLTSFGLNPTMRDLRSLMDYSARTGGSLENLNEIVAQLGQAWSKEKLQQEDAIVLMERGVPVWQLLSQVSGKTSAELMTMASNGQIGRSAISALIEQMGKVADGASAARLATWNGLVESAEALWKRFQATLAQGGVFQYAKDKLSEIEEVLEYAIQSGAARRWGEQIGESVTSIGTWVETLTKYTRAFVASVSIVIDGFSFAVHSAAGAVTSTVSIALNGVAALNRSAASATWGDWSKHFSANADAAAESARAIGYVAEDNWKRVDAAAADFSESLKKIALDDGGVVDGIGNSWGELVKNAKAYNTEAAKSRKGAAEVADELARAKANAQGLSSAMASGSSGSGMGAGGGAAAQPSGPDAYDDMTAEQLKSVREQLNKRRSQALERFRAGQLTDLELGQINIDIGQEERLTRGLGKADALKRQQMDAANAAVPGLDSLIARVKVEIDPDGVKAVDIFKKNIATPITIPVSSMIARGDVDLRTEKQLNESLKLADKGSSPIASIPGATIARTPEGVATPEKQPSVDITRSAVDPTRVASWNALHAGNQLSDAMQAYMVNAKPLPLKFEVDRGDVVEQEIKQKFSDPIKLSFDSTQAIDESLKAKQAFSDPIKLTFDAERAEHAAQQTKQAFSDPLKLTFDIAQSAKTAADQMIETIRAALASAAFAVPVRAVVTVDAGGAVQTAGAPLPTADSSGVDRAAAKIGTRVGP